MIPELDDGLYKIGPTRAFKITINFTSGKYIFFGTKTQAIAAAKTLEKQLRATAGYKITEVSKYL